MPTRSFVSKWLWIGLASVVTATGLWAYATHTHDELFDTDLASRADRVCASARAELGSPPPLPPSPTFEARASRVEELTTSLRRMVADLRALEPPGSNATFDRWLEVWAEFVAAGEAYADAIRTGDPTLCEPAGDVADLFAVELARIADANGMTACNF